MILQIRADVQTFYIVCYTDVVIEKVKYSLLDLLEFEIQRHPIFILLIKIQIS